MFGGLCLLAAGVRDSVVVLDAVAAKPSPVHPPSTLDHIWSTGAVVVSLNTRLGLATGGHPPSQSTFGDLKLSIAACTTHAAQQHSAHPSDSSAAPYALPTAAAADCRPRSAPAVQWGFKGCVSRAAFARLGSEQDLSS